jgi:hypothetical protein
MAQFTKTNGDFLPVLRLDSASYTNGGLNKTESGATVQPQGPKLDFFTVTATGALSDANVNTVIQTLQQLATVYIYEYTDTTNDTLAVAMYPTGAWSTTAIDTALTAAGVTGTTTTATATFTN